MRVLLITFSDNADHQDTLFGMYEQLIRVCDVYLLTIRNPKVPLQKSDHTKLVDCPKRPGIERKTFDIITLYSIIQWIKSKKFDVVYFESLHVWNLAIMIAIGKNARKYQVIHEVIPHEGDSQVRGVELMNKAVCRIADIIVLRNRKYITHMMKKYAISSSKVKCLELWRRFPPFTLPVFSGRVLFFGRINPYKGIDNLIEIVRMCPEIQFDIIGRVDPNTKDLVETLAKEKNVNLVNGYVTNTEMEKAFINSDWVVVPYNTASQSGVIIDAYKFSRPVIAFNVGAIAEQVDEGRSGFLIEPGKNDAFAKKLKDVIKMDKESYFAMCSYAYRYGSEKYSVCDAVDRFKSLIQGD